MVLVVSIMGNGANSESVFVMPPPEGTNDSSPFLLRDDDTRATIVSRYSKQLKEKFLLEEKDLAEAYAGTFATVYEELGIARGEWAREPAITMKEQSMIFTFSHQHDIEGDARLEVEVSLPEGRERHQSGLKRKIRNTSSEPEPASISNIQGFTFARVTIEDIDLDSPTGTTDHTHITQRFLCDTRAEKGLGSYGAKLFKYNDRTSDLLPVNPEFWTLNAHPLEDNQRNTEVRFTAGVPYIVSGKEQYINLQPTQIPTSRVERMELLRERVQAGGIRERIKLVPQEIKSNLGLDVQDHPVLTQLFANLDFRVDINRPGYFKKASEYFQGRADDDKGFLLVFRMQDKPFVLETAPLSDGLDETGETSGNSVPLKLMIGERTKDGRIKYKRVLSAMIDQQGVVSELTITSDGEQLPAEITPEGFEDLTDDTEKMKAIAAMIARQMQTTA